MNSYSAPPAPPKLDKGARGPPDPPQPFPVPFRPPARACGARFFSFFTGNTSKKSPLCGQTERPRTRSRVGLPRDGGDGTRAGRGVFFAKRDLADGAHAHARGDRAANVPRSQRRRRPAA
eukprot:scaffold1538_cov70-Phaeocystis_antarctica.AAC.2